LNSRRHINGEIVLALALAFTPSSAVPEESGPSALVETAPVATRTVTESVATFGMLDADPDEVMILSLQHAGLIKRVWVSRGQRVSRDDALLEVTTAPDARMRFLQAQNALDYAQRELNRQERLLQQHLAGKADVEKARQSRDDATAMLDSLKRRGLENTDEIIRAPAVGVVTRLDVAQGERIQADTTALLLAAGNHVIARLGVEPENLDVIKPGATVTITPVFGSEHKVETIVREVHGMIDPATNLVEILVSIPAGAFEPVVLGTRVRGEIQLESRDALVVPRSAVLTAAGAAYLYVARDGRAQRISVTKGVEIGELQEVRGALTSGDRVVVSGNYELEDGMAVRESP